MSPCLDCLQGKLQLIAALMLAAGIIAQQRKQLPQDFLPLGYVMKRPSSSITFLDGYIEKRVTGQDAAELQLQLGELKAVYAATADSEYLVHSVSQTGPRVTHWGEYVVCVVPVGRSMSSSSPPQDSIQTRDAIR